MSEQVRYLVELRRVKRGERYIADWMRVEAWDASDLSSLEWHEYYHASWWSRANAPKAPQ